MTAGAQEKFPGKFFDYGGAVFNVMHLDFGAVADAATDDGPAWNLARAAVPTAGGVVLVPPGSYLLTTAFTFASQTNVLLVIQPGVVLTGSALPTPAGTNAILDYRSGVMTHTGKIGIGVTSPDRPLHIEGEETQIKLTPDAATESASIIVDNDGAVQLVGNAELAFPSTWSQYDASRASGMMVIDSAGDFNYYYQAAGGFSGGSWGPGLVKIDGSTGRMLISAAATTTVDTAAMLEIVAPGDGLSLVMGDSPTDATSKDAMVGVKHYTNAEEVTAMIYGFSGSGVSTLYVGGGTSFMNAVEDIRFFTAADDVTTTGTERMRVMPNGDVRVGSGSAIATSAVAGFLLIPGCAGAPSGDPTNDGVGAVALVYDTTNNTLYANDGGGWNAV